MHGRKRLFLAAGTLASVGAVVALAVGVTFGLFSGTPQTSSTSNFSTGSVSIGSPANVACSVSNMVPGDDSTGYSPDLAGRTDAQTGACEFQVTYTGSAPAYIGLSSSESGTLATALKWEVAQSATDNAQPGAFASGGVINTNSALDPLYVATDAGGDNTVYTFWVDYALPRSVTSQSLTAATLNLTVYAVQSGNNGTAADCVVGSQCDTLSTGIPNWS